MILVHDISSHVPSAGERHLAALQGAIERLALCVGRFFGHHLGGP